MRLIHHIFFFVHLQNYYLEYWAQPFLVFLCSWYRCMNSFLHWHKDIPFYVPWISHTYANHVLHVSQMWLKWWNHHQAECSTPNLELMIRGIIAESKGQPSGHALSTVLPLQAAPEKIWLLPNSKPPTSHPASRKLPCVSVSLLPSSSHKAVSCSRIGKKNKTQMQQYGSNLVKF